MNRTAVIAVLLAAGPLSAQEREEPAEPRVHTVRPGDTLWDIARVYLNDPFLWPEIFRLNTDVVRDPALIYPSERLRLPGPGPGPGRAVEPARPTPARTVFQVRDQGPEVAEGPTFRAWRREEVTAVTAGDFYSASFVALEREVGRVGYVAELKHETVIPLGMSPQIQLYNRIYIPLDPGASARVGDQFQLLRPADRLGGYGRLYRVTGMVTVAALERGVATAVVTDMFDQIELEDWAVPMPDFPLVPGVHPASASGLEGTIVTFQRPHTLQMTEEIAILDLGARAGVQEGDEFLAFVPPRERRWGVRPEVEIARLQVVRVMENTSSARVSDLKQPALEEGLPVRLIAKMP